MAATPFSRSADPVLAMVGQAQVHRIHFQIDELLPERRHCVAHLIVILEPSLDLELWQIRPFLP